MSKKLLNFFLILATFAIYYLVMRPLYAGGGSLWQPAESIKSLLTKQVQYDTTLTQAADLKNKADDLIKQYSKITNVDKEKMSVMVPDSVDKVRLLDEVDAIGRKSGLVLSNVHFMDGPLTATGMGTAGISFTAKTSYPKFKELIENFERSMRLYSVQNVTFSAPDKEGQTTTYQVRLETYYIK